MAGFEMRTSAVGSNRSTNNATTIAIFNLVNWLILQSAEDKFWQTFCTIIA